MTDEKWLAAWNLYEAAVDLPASEHQTFVHSASSDPEIIQRVLTMLTAEVGPLGFATKAAPGAAIGRYTIIGELGRGGMGIVYSARDEELDRDVALKFLSSAVFMDKTTIAQFIREAKAASALNHPNIVTVYEVIRDESEVAIAMELIEGKSLRSFCGTPLPLVQVAHLGKQMAHALAAAHARGIVHRDIKPENILVRDDGYAKVLDFGLARRIDSGQSSATGLPAGTLRYMSPEQSRGEPVTGSSDVFSLGLILYELATGKHPFAAESPFATAHDILTKDPAPPSTLNRSISARLESLVLSMLAKDQRARPSAAQVAQTLEEISVSIQKPGRRPRQRWIGVSVAFLAATAFGLWQARERIFPRREPIFRQITTNATENRVVAAAISPNGRALAYADHQGLILWRDIATGNTRSLSAPSDFQADRIVWFSDGIQLAISGHSPSTKLASIWIFSMKDARPHLVRENATNATPSPDGSKLAFISADGRQIWVCDFNGQNWRNLAVTAKPNYFSALLWTPSGRAVAYQRLHELQRHYDSVRAVPAKAHYEFVDVATGKINLSLPDMVVESGATLSDGRIFFLQPEPKEGFEQDLWVMRIDPRTDTLIGPPRQIWSKRQIALHGLTISSDGKLLAVVGLNRQTDVHVGDLERPNPRLTNFRRLTLDLAEDFVHAWTPDSQAVIFESIRNGTYDLFKQTPGKAVFETLVADPGHEALPQVSPDGRWVLYASWPPGLGDARKGFTLRRVPIQGGASEPVPIAGVLDEFRCPTYGGSCILRTTENDQHIFHELDAIRGKGRELARIATAKSLLGDWALSSDGARIAIPNHDPVDGRIRILELYGQDQLRSREVVLTDLTDLWGVHWDIDGEGWFVHAATESGMNLYYVDLRGHSRLLREACRWGVPSPDGRRLATATETLNGNVWMIEGF